MPTERENAIKFGDKPATLIGDEVKAGQKAPAFTAAGPGLAPVSLKDYPGQVKIFLTVPSLDTSVCSTETKKFSQMAAGFPDNVKILVASMDLPFAQARWCGAQGVDNVVCISDFREKEVGEAFGVLIKGVGLLSRAVFVIDQENVVRYVEYLPEVPLLEPDYDAVKAAVESLL